VDLDLLDFYIFYANLSVSLRRDIPVQENLREVMAAVLHKALVYSAYDGAIHIFTNPRLGEAHAMALLRDSDAWQALEQKAIARAGIPIEGTLEDVPRYAGIAFGRDWEPANDALSEDPVVGMQQVRHPFEARVQGDVRELLGRIRTHEPGTPDTAWPEPGQALVVVPLGRFNQRRLGALLLWRRASREPARLDGIEGEAFLQFGLGVGRLVFRIFETMYQMKIETYLPSYYCPQRRPVALLCAELRHLDLIENALDTRNDIDVRECLRALVNRFFRTVASEVERFKGRVDQMWSGGLLAVFGEYLDTPDAADIVACMRAIQAAAVIVEAFERETIAWMKEDFCLERYRQHHNRHVATGVAVAVSFGDVQLDYLGSADHQRYMAFGDQVSFVRDLVNVAGRTALDEGTTRLDAPIVASQAIFAKIRSACIQTTGPHQAFAEVETPKLVRFPGRRDCFPVYPLWPGNVTVRS
jgi:class 3 adenylate cyclase